MSITWSNVKFKNIKNGKIYIVLGGAKDKTNTRDGLNYVVYHEEGFDDLYVRDLNEFIVKFDLYEAKNAS